MIKISPFHLFDNQFNVSGEFFNTKTYKSSFLTGVSFIYADNDNVTDQGAYLDLQYRIYPRGFTSDTAGYYLNTAKGFYFAFGSQIGYNEFRDKSLTKNSGENVNVSTQNTWVQPFVNLGFQFIVWEALYVDCYIGGGIKMNQVEKKTDDPTLDLEDYYKSTNNLTSRYYKGILPRAGVTLGVGF